MIAELVTRLRYRYVPDHIVGEVLGRRWMDNVIPVFLLVALTIYLADAIPNFVSVGNLSDTSRQIGEFGLIVIGMTIVMLAGGIDLSVGSTFALANFTALALINVAKWPVEAAIVATIGVGGAAWPDQRPADRLSPPAGVPDDARHADADARHRRIPAVRSTRCRIASSDVESDLWDFVGAGSVLGAPVSLVVLIVVAIAAHIVLTRLRIGWRIMAVGGSRRSSYNAGIPVRATVCLTYVVSGMLAGLAGILYAARLSGAGPDTGLGLELTAVTAALLGGNSVGGGRGSIGKALMGAIIVSLLTNGLVRLGLQNGASSMVVGLVLLLAIAIDVRWVKWRYKTPVEGLCVAGLSRLCRRSPTIEVGSSSPYAMNDRLRDVEVIGLGRGRRTRGRHSRWRRQSLLQRAARRHHPLSRARLCPRARSMRMSAAGRSAWPSTRTAASSCASRAWASTASTNCATLHKMTAETNRTRLSVIDDSRMRLADDLDIAPDGKVYFSEATIRYGFEEWVVDALEGRGNGRIIRYDPATGATRTIVRNLLFANGMCMAHDNKSVLFAETWGCRVSRYWLEGPKAGTTEIVIADLPGYPDNINRGSRGTYWVALAGTRTPTYDLAMTHAGLPAAHGAAGGRRRMDVPQRQHRLRDPFRR